MKGKTFRLSIFSLLGFYIPVCLSVDTPPDAGRTLQQLQENMPEIPRKPDTGIDVQQPPSSPTGEASSVRINIKNIRFSGNTVFSEARLRAVVNDAIGKQLSLNELRMVADKVTRFYREHGYLVARAYIPAQEIRDNIIELAVIEGKYGTIDLNNSSSLSDQRIRGLLGSIKSEQVIEARSLEKNILLLNDVPGIDVNATLKPGTATSTADLVLDVNRTKLITGDVELDNFGNRYTGNIRLGAGVNFNNLAGFGDLLSVRGLTTGGGLNYGQFDYSVLASNTGLRLGGGYSYMEYELGKEFSSLNAHGRASLISVYGTYPLKRSRDFNLNTRVQLDHKQLADRVDAVNTATDKRLNTITFNLLGNNRDNFGSGGITSFSFSLNAGDLSLSPAAELSDAITSRTNGTYAKFNTGIQRQQYLTETLALYISLAAQLASKNLDSSEKFSLGGPRGVRAYPSGEATGDHGYLINAELRWRWKKQLELISFIDVGGVIINKRPWTTEENRRRLSGIGLGFQWIKDSNYLLRATYAHKLDNEPATADNDRSGRFWLEAIHFF